MSAGAIFQEVLRVFNRQHIPETSHRNLLAALEAGRPGPLAFLYEAGAEAGLLPQQILTRAAAIYFNFCAGNLADDLSDGECTYLTDPSRIGPCTQYILQTLFFHTLMEVNLPSSTLSLATRELSAAAGRQFVEIHTQQWNVTVFQEVAEGIAGRQWCAYLQILWGDTTLAGRAAVIGMNMGRAGHVVEDIRSGDRRYTTLPNADKREVVAWATIAAQALREEHLNCLDAVLRMIDPVLKEAV